MSWDPYGSLIRMAASSNTVLDLHGTEHGLFLGPGIPLVATTLDKHGTPHFAPSSRAELESWLGLAYGGPVDLADRMPILERVAAAYNRGSPVQALIAAARLRLPPLDRAGLERLARGGLIKANFNPAEPRDWHGRWTSGGDDRGPRDRNAPPPPFLRPLDLRPLAFRRPASPFPGAQVEPVGRRLYSGSDLGFVARSLGIDRHKFGNIIHSIKDPAGLDGDDDLEFDIENGDVYFNGQNIDNVFNY